MNGLEPWIYYILSACSAGGRDTRPITLPNPASRIRTSYHDKENKLNQSKLSRNL